MEDVYITGRKINELNSLKLNAANITAYTAALKGLNTKQVELVLSTQGLTVAQKQAILSQTELLSTTGKLTTAELEAILVSKKRNKDQAEALLINTGLITSETTEAATTNIVTAAKLKELVQTKALTQAEADLIAAKAGVILTSQKESSSLLANIGTNIKGAGIALKGLGTGILTIIQAHPVIAGITAALTLCGGAALVNKVKQENAAKAIKEAYYDAKKAIDDINSTYSANSSEVKEISEEYAVLAQGVDLLTNSNKNLSTEKHERFLELSNQLSKIFPSLTKNFDENDNAILNLSGDVNTIVGSLDNLIERQRILANQEIMKQMPDLFSGYSNNVTDLEAQKENAQKTKDEIQKAYEEIEKYGIFTAFGTNGIAKDENDDIVPLRIGQYINLLEKLGIAIKQINLKDSFGQPIGYKLILEDGSDVPNLSGIYDYYISAFSKASDDLKYIEQQLDTEHSSINQYLNTWLQTEFSYNQLKENGLQKAVQEILFNFDWSSLPEGVDKNNWEAVSEYFRRNILFSVNNIDDSIVAKALADIYSGNLNSGELLDAIDRVQGYFGSEHPISTSLQPKIDGIQPLINNVQEKLQDDFDDTVGELTLEELQIAAEQIEVPEGTLLSWDELIAKIEEVQNATPNLETPFPQAWTASFTSEDESVRKLGNTLLELAEQGRLTIETFNNADSSDYFKNLGISADEAVSKINRMADESQQLSSMANQISSMSEALDTKQAEGFVSADVLSGFDAEVRGLESWDKFQTFLGSVSTSYDECQEAASALASEWINNSDFLAQLTEENKEYYATQLEAMGIENYEEIISYAQSLNEAKEALAQANEMSGEATQDEIEALIAEGAYSELTAGLILQLYDAKIAEKALTLDTSADCEELIALAGDADKTSRSIQLLLQLKDIYNGFESGIYDGNRLLREEALAEVDRIKGELEELANGESENSITMPGVTLGNKGKSAAKSAGQSAGNAYVDAFEKELDDLKTLRDRGTITEKAYLDEFRRLYQRYYRDKKKYAEEYAKYEHEYLQGMKSLYESALSGITSMLDKQIGTYEDQKSAAVDSLEAERDARIEVLETQKEQYEEQIKLIDEQIEAKEKIIDGINEEIDAIKDANEQRKREIDLEKSKYELERMMNQRTILQYSADKGMHYTQDTEGARDAKQAVEDAELEIEIAGISGNDEPEDLKYFFHDKFQGKIFQTDFIVNPLFFLYNKVITNAPC